MITAYLPGVNGLMWSDKSHCHTFHRVGYSKHHPLIIITLTSHVRQCVSDHLTLDWWFNSFFRLTIEKISKPRITSSLWGESIDDRWISPDSKVRGANMGPTWVLSAPDGFHVGPMNLAIWVPYKVPMMRNALPCCDFVMQSCSVLEMVRILSTFW